jgi:hypothetical protein
MRPQVGLQLAFAGPYESGKRFLFDEPAGVSVAPVSGEAPAEGAIGPQLFGIEHRLSQEQIAETTIDKPIDVGGGY